MSIVSLRNNLAGWMDSILSVASEVPADVLSLQDVNRLQSAMQAALNALDSVKSAEEQAIQILADQDVAGKTRIQRAQQLRESATATADSALRNLKSVADATYAAVEKSWRPRKPSGVDSATILDRKADVCLLLEHGGTSASQIGRAAQQLLSDAMVAGDPDSQLTAYVVAGRPLDLWYRAHGISDDAQAQLFAAVARTGGADLTPLIGSGKGTLSGFVQVARSELNDTLQRMRDRFAGSIYLAGRK